MNYSKKDKSTKAKAFPKNAGNGKRPKFLSRSVHGSGAFTDQDIRKGYRCENAMGS